MSEIIPDPANVANSVASRVSEDDGCGKWKDDESGTSAEFNIQFDVTEERRSVSAAFSSSLPKNEIF